MTTWEESGDRVSTQHFNTTLPGRKESQRQGGTNEAKWMGNKEGNWSQLPIYKNVYKKLLYLRIYSL